MLFTIGQVAKMYNISHDTLRYYDRIDLLKPSEKKDIIQKEDEDEYIKLFKNHKKLLEKKIKDLTKLKDEAQYSIEAVTKMKKFNNNENIEIRKEYIDKTIVYFHQNDYGYFNDIMKQKNIIFKTDYIKGSVIIDENIIGFELKEEHIEKNEKYEVINYKGKYVVLSIKDTILNIEKFINSNIERIYENKLKHIDVSINIFIESLFMMFKKNNENIYFVKIYIELI